MKVTCTQENLLRGISFVSHVAGKNISLPILNNILLSATETGLDLIATNLEIGVRARVRAKVEEVGSYTINAKLFSEYVQLLPRGNNIVLETTDGELKTSCGTQQSHIKGMSAEEFPILPTIEEESAMIVRLSIEQLRDCIQQTLFTIAMNDARPEISGVLFRVLENKLTVVGTDSYRLAEKTVSLATESGDRSVIIPGRTWSELLRICGLDLEDDVVITISENQCSVQVGDVFLISRLIEGQYPDYQQIIPSTPTTHVTVHREELLHAVKSASLFSKTGINDIVLAVSGKTLRVSSSNAQVGENVMEIEVEKIGEDVSITFNHRYLADGLASLDSESVLLEFVDKNSPGIVRSKDQSDFLYIVMPIKQ